MIDKSRSLAVLLLAAFLVPLSLPGCSSWHPLPFHAQDGHNRSAASLFSGQPPHNLVLITIDTLRADHLGCYGYRKSRTPAIDALARQGILFRQAFSPVPLTLPSHASILTGLYPPVHGIRDNGYFILDDGYQTLAEILKEKGYATAAIVASFVLNSRFGLDQGFDFYEDDIAPDPNRNDSFRYERRGDEVLKLARDWLAQHKDRKFFLWLHLYDPHDPYDPPEPHKSIYASEPYDGEIAYTDACLGQLLDTLDKLKLRDNTLLILTADHGEGCGEHGEKTHGVFIYDSTLHVPLIISSPRFKRFEDGIMLKIAGQPPLYPNSPDFLVRTIDILPTTLALLGLAEPGKSYGQGINLVPWLADRRKPSPDLRLYAESLYTKLNFDWSSLKGVRTRDWKYIQAPTPELYQTVSDPAETENLLLREPERAQGWEKELQEMEKGFAAAGSAKGAARPKVVNDQEIRKRLQSLGYLSAPRQEKASRSGSDRPAIDPKDMAQVLESLDQGQTLYAAGKLEAAARQFEKILTVDPGNIFIHYLLGDVYSRQGDYRTALDHYLAVLKEQDDYLETHNKIGSVYDHLNDHEQAARHFQKAASLHPDQPRAYNNLGIISIKTNRLAEAEKAFLHALALSREQDDAQETAVSLRCLGDTRLRMNDLEKARQYYQQALSINPSLVEVYLELARYYTSQGQYALAIPQWEQAVALLPRDAQAVFALGQCCLMAGDRQKAGQLFRQCLQIQPDHAQARSLLERLDGEGGSGQ
ncbi:MAG: sulfatase-like hydrolase/transferase [bacterium]